MTKRSWGLVLLIISLLANVYFCLKLIDTKKEIHAQWEINFSETIDNLIMTRDLLVLEVDAPALIFTKKTLDRQIVRSIHYSDSNTEEISYALKRVYDEIDWDNLIFTREDSINILNTIIEGHNEVNTKFINHEITLNQMYEQLAQHLKPFRGDI